MHEKIVAFAVAMVCSCMTDAIEHVKFGTKRPVLESLQRKGLLVVKKGVVATNSGNGAITEELEVEHPNVPWTA